ncbi:MAG: hypothetical protein J6023_01835 [Clostridia bacterium]|nr:hypothetical protein [Clostridia bacterium]
MLRKLCLVLSILLLILSFASCGSIPGPAGAETESDTQENQDGETETEPYEFQREYSGDIWFKNGFRNEGTSAFSCPKAEPDSLASIGFNDHAFYMYEEISEEAFANYLNVLESEGFSVYRMLNHTFCRTDDCLLYLIYTSGRSHLELYWYARSAGAPADGLTEQDAQLSLCPKKTLSPLSLRPVDVTPEGFYARTGGQIFAVPSYSFDTYTETNNKEQIKAEYENYSCRILFVRGDEQLYSNLECFAAADLDGEGTEEICALKASESSGVSAFVFLVLSGSETFDDSFYTPIISLFFGKQDGQLIVLGMRQHEEALYGYGIRSGSFVGIRDYWLYALDPGSKLLQTVHATLTEKERDPKYEGVSQTMYFYPDGSWSCWFSVDEMIAGTYEETDSVLACSADYGGKITFTALIEGPGVIRILSVLDETGTIPWLHPGDILSEVH